MKFSPLQVNEIDDDAECGWLVIGRLAPHVKLHVFTICGRHT